MADFFSTSLIADGSPQLVATSVNFDRWVLVNTNSSSMNVRVGFSSAEVPGGYAIDSRDHAAFVLPAHQELYVLGPSGGTTIGVIVSGNP